MEFQLNLLYTKCFHDPLWLVPQLNHDFGEWNYARIRPLFKEEYIYNNIEFNRINTRRNSRYVAQAFADPDNYHFARKIMQSKIKPRQGSMVHPLYQHPDYIATMITFQTFLKSSINVQNLQNIWTMPIYDQVLTILKARYPLELRHGLLELFTCFLIQHHPNPITFFYG